MPHSFQFQVSLSIDLLIYLHSEVEILTPINCSFVPRPTAILVKNMALYSLPIFEVVRIFFITHMYVTSPTWKAIELEHKISNVMSFGNYEGKFLPKKLSVFSVYQYLIV